MPTSMPDRRVSTTARRVVGVVTGAALATAAVAMSASASGSATAGSHVDTVRVVSPQAAAAPASTTMDISTTVFGGFWMGGVGGVGTGSVAPVVGPVVTKPVAKKPVAKKPVVKKPVVKKPVVKKVIKKVTTSTDGMPTLRFANGTTVSTAGLSSNAIKVLRAVNGTFPSIRDIGTIRGDAGAQDHATGHAVDLMIPAYNTAAGRALGTEIAAFMRLHASELGVHYIIWSQHIWNVQRAGEGWRSMSDRGSITANHYDHVHVSVY